jgi:hypothetical protein
VRNATRIFYHIFRQISSVFLNHLNNSKSYNLCSITNSEVNRKATDKHVGGPQHLYYIIGSTLCKAPINGFSQLLPFPQKQNERFLQIANCQVRKHVL